MLKAENCESGFARFPDWDSCTLEMSKLGHDKESAVKICGAIKERSEKGALLKAQALGLEVLSKANEEDIVLGGNAQWEIEDEDGDILTVDAQVKALNRFFSQAPEFQLVTLDHAKGALIEVKAAQPQLKYVNSKGEEFFSHVHEAGTYFLTKIRNDALKTTQWIRAQAKAGNFTGYSVNVVPLLRDSENPKRILDAEYTAVTITTKGVCRPKNPMTRDVKVLSKADAKAQVCPQPPSDVALKIDLEAIFERYGLTHTRKPQV